MANPLIDHFTGLCGALRGLQEQVERLGAIALHASCLSYPKTMPPSTRGVTDTREAENSNSSVSLHDNNIQKERESSIGDKRNSKSKPEAVNAAKKDQMKHKKHEAGAVPGVKRRGNVGKHQGISNKKVKRRKTQTGKASQPAWTWERHIREKIPRKYQSPAELKKLENIVLYLKNRHCAISISDLVKHSDLPVIRCKEILQTLMKLNIIERKREKSGFVYSFGSSDML